MMREYFKYIIKFLMRNLLRIFWLFPVKKNKIFFMSNMGKNFSCNPMYLYKYFLSKNNNYKYVWAFVHINEYKFLNSNNTKIVSKKNYFKYFYHLLTSKVIIYNCGGFSYAPIRKNQLLVETWHGGGAYKKCGLSVTRKSKFSKRGVMWASRSIKLFISPSRKTTDTLILEAFNYKGMILDSGLPRNDIFFNNNIDEIRNQLKRKLKIKENAKVLLYAPTFRGNEWNANSLESKYEEIDFKKLKKVLSDKYGCEWNIAIRSHQYACLKIDDGVDLDFSKFADMQELLLITDILITDYSSSIWDFGLQNKPAFLYCPDVHNYQNNDRGFYVPIEKWQGILCKNNSELLTSITNFNQKNYIQKLKESYSSFGSYETGNACKIIYDKIAKLIKE